MLIVRSPVRISLAGGGTDLPAYYRQHGGVVLSTAINKYFYSVLCRRSDDKIQIISSDLRVSETWTHLAVSEVCGSRLEIPLAVVKHLNRPVSCDLFLASEILPGTGLGSSASVCVNILTALSHHLQVPLSKYELAESAYHIARNVLKKPVGKQDEYAAAFGGLNYIEFNPDDSTRVTPLFLPGGALHDLEDRLMLFFTGISHDSWSILKSQERSTAKPAGATVSSLHSIKDLAYRMRESLEAGDIDSVGALLHEGWEAKKKLSGDISNSRIDGLYDLARQSGARGGKITGAGGGGFLLLYCDLDKQDQVRHALAAEGLQEMSFRFDNAGAQVITDDPFLDGDRESGLCWNFIAMNGGLSIPS